MKILMANLDIDCAGVSWNLACALRALGVEVRHVLCRRTFAACNTDYAISCAADIIPHIKWADVVHYNHQPWEPELDDFPNKRVVFHFHGGPTQVEPESILSACRYRGAGILVCDPITALREGVTWMPNILSTAVIPDPIPRDVFPFKVGVMCGVGDLRRNNGLIREVLKQLAGSRQMVYNFYSEIPYIQCLNQRMGDHVTVDNLTQGFVGMWSWEAMLMGQPVLARLSPVAVSAYQSFFGSPPPVLQCDNVDDIAWWLRKLYSSKNELDIQSRRALEWSSNLADARIARAYLDYYKSL